MEWDDEAPARGLDLPRLIAAVAQRKRWIVLPTLAAFLLALAFVTLAKPHYTATAKVLLQNGDNYFTRPGKDVPDAAAPIDDMTVESEAEAAKSPDVERQAMARLKPADLAEFSGGGLMSWLSRGGVSPEERRLAAFAKRVDIYPQTKTRVLLFEFTSLDRDRAARGADALAEAFLESQRAVKDAEAKSAAKWLSDQIDLARVKVTTAEGRVEALRAQSGLLPVASGVAAPTQALSDITAQIAAARAAEAAATAKAEALRNMVRNGRLDDVASVANDDLLRRYAETRFATKARIAELSRTLLPGHPRMKELQGELSGLDEEIRAAAMKRVRGFEEDARIAAAQVKTLQQAVANQTRAVTARDADQVKLRELEIDAKSARDQLESYLTKYREAIARGAENAAPANGRVIAYALAPASPSFPKTGPTLLLSALAAFFVSLGLVIARILFAEGAAGAAAQAPPAPAREARLPFGIDPAAPAPAPPPPALREERARPFGTAAVEGFVDRLADTSDGESLALVVAGEGATEALPAALVAARRLTRLGATALVDLGPSPEWLSDMLDRERGSARAGLSRLVADPGALTEAVHRDLSTELDIILSGDGAVAADDLPPVLEALGRVYAFVVVHVADWRDAAYLAEDIAAMLLIAPAAEIRVVEARACAAFRDEGLAIKAIGVEAEPEELAA
jgi:succinoglycan biosynthesis transport protein ExoP